MEGQFTAADHVINSHSILLTNCPDPWNFSRKYFQLLLLRPQSDTRKVVLT